MSSDRINGEARAAGLPARPYSKLLEQTLGGATLTVNRVAVIAAARERYDWSVTIPADYGARITECGSLFATPHDEDAERRVIKRGRAALKSTADRIEAGHE